VDFLSFTGSTATGRKLMELSSRSNGKPLLMECGGKSPQIVFEDVDDLAQIAAAAVRSAFANQGQVCVARTRLLVHASIKTKLLAAIVENARRRVPANPLEETTRFGPVASPAQRSRIKRYVDLGIAEGADAVLVGAIRESGGCCVSPTI